MNVEETGWRVILRYNEDFYNKLDVWFINSCHGGRQVVMPIDLTITSELTPMTTLPEPTLSMEGVGAHQFLQSLAQGLAEAGFRPDLLKSTDKELEAVRYHLEDMRKLVFPASNIVTIRGGD